MAGYSGGQKSKIITRIIILAGVAVLAGAVIFFFARKKSQEPEMSQGEEERMEKDRIALQDMKDQDEAAESVSSAVPEESPEPELELTLIPLSELNLMGYEKVEGLSGECVLDQYAPDEYKSANLVDGDVNTYWMACGLDIPTVLGEKFKVNLPEEREVKYLLLNLGVWSDFYSRETLTGLGIRFSGRPEAYSMEFPDEQTQFVVELSEAVPVRWIQFTTGEVSDHGGSYAACVSEIEVYAKIRVQKGNE